MPPYITMVSCTESPEQCLKNVITVMIPETYCYSFIYILYYSFQPRTPVHELLHALGMHHEHQRPDRDKYVTVFPSNIQSSMLFAFDKKTLADGVDPSVPFDVSSVMEYDGTVCKTPNADLHF